MAVYTCNSCIRQADAGGSRVPGQPELHSKTLIQKQRERERKRERERDRERKRERERKESRHYKNILSMFRKV
jgi:hypothetical protein